MKETFILMSPNAVHDRDLIFNIAANFKIAADWEKVSLALGGKK